MASYPHLIDVGIMGHCIHGKTGLCAKAGIGYCQSGMLVEQPNVSVDDFKWIAEQSKGKCNQFALGGRGDPDQHGNEYDLDLGMDSYFNESGIPHVVGSTLVYTDDGCNSSSITTVYDLLASLYCLQSDEALPFSVVFAIFAFLNRGLSPGKFLDKLKKIDGFERFEEIDPDDYDDGEGLREELLEMLAENLEVQGCSMDITDERTLAQFRAVAESVKKITHIEKNRFQHQGKQLR